MNCGTACGTPSCCYLRRCLLIAISVVGAATESLEHEADHGDVDHGFAVFHQFLIVLAESPGMSQPGERAFHDPALAKELKTSLLFQLTDNFQDPTTPAFDP